MTTLVASPSKPNSPDYGQTVTFTATVKVFASGMPTGLVTFNGGGKTLGTGTLVTTDGVTTATFSTSESHREQPQDHSGLLRRQLFFPQYEFGGDR